MSATTGTTTTRGDTGTGPPLTGFHHFSITVTDVEASAAWYEQVLGLQRLPVRFPHHGSEEHGYGVLLLEPALGFGIGLHHNDANPGGAADERRTGLDHFAVAVPARSDLDAWAAHFDRLGVAHAGVTDTDDPIPYSVLVFRDPDNVQLELIHLPG